MFMLQIGGTESSSMNDERMRNNSACSSNGTSLSSRSIPVRTNEEINVLTEIFSN